MSLNSSSFLQQVRHNPPMLISSTLSPNLLSRLLLSCPADASDSVDGGPCSDLIDWEYLSPHSFLSASSEKFCSALHSPLLERG